MNAAPDQAHAVVLAGGRGTRFWPLSRRARPKQLLDLTGSGPLLRLTLDRLSPVVPPERQWILTSRELVDSVRSLAPAVPAEQVIGEPVGRNTAPAVGLAAAVLEAAVGPVPFAVLPSDHLISPVGEFHAALLRALAIAAAGDLLITFGVAPQRPETGYGYIEVGEAVPGAEPALRAVSFCEKPDRDTAERYLLEGRHLWNSGMFAWRTDTLLDGLVQHFEPAVSSLSRAAAAGAPGTPGFAAALERAYEEVPSISIDYALMEKAQNVGVLPVSFEWSDVGHWLAMRELWGRDEAGNASQGSLLAVDSRDCVVYGPERLTALLGVEDLVVVQTDDATLICAAERVQEIGRLLRALEASGEDDYL